MPIQFVYFDCMDTLIQMDVPSLDIYGDWAFQAARGLDLWEDSSSFCADWSRHRERLLSSGDLREGTILGRIRDLLRERALRIGSEWLECRIEEEARRIHQEYWATYRAAAFVLPEVRPTLLRVQRENQIPLGVVSNFMVEGGIPSLLYEHGLEHFFQVVLVSCDHGFRKPSPTIYQAAIRAAGVAPEEILFVGDDLVSDYQGPRSMGMNSLLYDRRGLHREVEHRVESLQEIESWIEG
jgi:putative hydrolase of the HAD superfamily